MSGNRGKGRPKGAVNKATRDIKELARELAPAATKRLQELLASDSESVALGAVKEIYDRAYGKATQPIEGGDKPLRVVHKIELVGGDGV
tara:strand:+ start:1452 stop:1718 length:267 start_codon:yes stop_codon:yes gene_type:complete